MSSVPASDTSPRPRTGGEILVDQLLLHGVNTAFCVPGESYLAALDALHDARDRIRLYVARQEGGAANMAEAYGKLTGRPGVCFVTRGPGATNASIGVHTARQDSTPMVLFVGQVETKDMGREAFQELDHREVFGGLAKWATQIDDASRIPEIVSRAFTTATSGRPGPVVVALPEDMLRSTVATQDAVAYRPVHASPGAEALAALRSMLEESERPMVVLGGSAWTDEARSSVRSFAELWGLPVCTAFRRQDLFDSRSPSFAGPLGSGAAGKLKARFREADLVLALGTRLSEATTNGYSLIEAPRPSQRLVHVRSGVEELGRVYQADLLINSGMPALAEALRGLEAPREVSWSAWTKEAREDYLSQVAMPEERPGLELDLARVVAHIRDEVPNDAIVTNGAGNFTAWCHRYFPLTEGGRQLAPTSGAMGYGVPAALAAKVVHPDRVVIAFTGDGDLLMAGQELATAKQYGLNVIVIVVNNGRYGSIRLHQEMHYPGRVIGTELENPDFVRFAEAFGAFGERVHHTESFPAAFARARSAGRPALLEIVMDRDVATPDLRLSDLKPAPEE